MTTGPNWIRSPIIRTLWLTAAALVLVAIASDLIDFVWDSDPDVARTILIAITMPALILPALAVALANPPAARQSQWAPAPDPAPEPQIEAPTRRRRPRRTRRRPRIVAPEPCVHCGHNPKALRRPVRIRMPHARTVPATAAITASTMAPRRSLAALIAAVTQRYDRPAPRRGPRIIQRH